MNQKISVICALICGNLREKMENFTQINADFKTQIYAD